MVMLSYVTFLLLYTKLNCSEKVKKFSNEINNVQQEKGKQAQAYPEW